MLALSIEELLPLAVATTSTTEVVPAGSGGAPVTGLVRGRLDLLGSDPARSRLTVSSRRRSP